MKKPCKECPFRKDSTAGYLGESSGNPLEFLNSMEHNMLPCHLTVNWDNESDFDEVRTPCIGGLQFLKNTCKMPQTNDKKYLALRKEIEPNKNVFDKRIDFIDHHTM